MLTLVGRMTTETQSDSGSMAGSLTVVSTQRTTTRIQGLGPTAQALPDLADRRVPGVAAVGQQGRRHGRAQDAQDDRQ